MGVNVVDAAEELIQPNENETAEGRAWWQFV